MKYDAIVIGSGFGGLVCAHLLSQAGQRVLVLERQSQLGGCIQSYQRKGHALDTGFHYVGGLGDGQRLQRIFSRLGLMRLPWQRLDPEGFDRVWIGQECFPFAEGYEQFVSVLSDRFPSEREALQRYVGMLQEVDSVAFGSSDAYRYFGESAYDYLSSTFSDPLLVSVLAGSALKMELRRETLPLFTFAHGNSSFIQSSWRLRGDGGLIVHSLADDIRRFGGELVCGAEVEEIIERQGRVEAVRCSNGEVYEATTFISDIHPDQTFSLIHDSAVIKRIFRRRISMLENTRGMFTVSLVIKPHSLPYFNHNKFVYRQPNVWTFAEDGHLGEGIMISCRVPEDGSDARLIDLLTPMPWEQCKAWSETTVGHRGDDYRRMKEQVMEKCLSLAETVLPGLRDMVDQVYTSSPLTYRDYTLAPFGTAYGVRRDCRNLVVTMLSPRTPLPNLLLTGQNLMLHGLEGVSMTALLTCSEILGKDYIQEIIK